MQGKSHLPTLIVTACALWLAGCSGLDSNVAAPVTAKFSHPRIIDNPYLPLWSLKQDILESGGERVERTAKPAIHRVFQIGGQSVEALAVEDREFDTKGKLTEVTLDYFAQDDAGNVYYLGEDVDVYKDGEVSGHGGAWLVGQDTQKPGLLMPAHPRIGDKFLSEDAAPITWEADQVVSLSENLSTPAGNFSNCLKIKEKASDGGTEYKVYAPNIGVIAEMDSDGNLLLKSHFAN